LPLGEVYVVGVDPDLQSRGLGRALTAEGLRYMWDQGVRTVDLYVESDNLAALAVYRSQGFVTHTQDTLYQRWSATYSRRSGTYFHERGFGICPSSVPSSCSNAVSSPKMFSYVAITNLNPVARSIARL